MQAIMEKGRGEFRCKTCGRAFMTYQALGGHRTGHSRLKERDEAMNGGGLTAKGKVRVHECKVCGQGFPMSQALGGHMRRHKDGVMSAYSIWKRDVGRTNVLDLDLNLIPIDDDDEVGLPELSLKLGIGSAM